MSPLVAEHETLNWYPQFNPSGEPALAFASRNQNRFQMRHQTSSHWDEFDLPFACVAWVKEVDRLMLEDFCIDLADAGADRADVLRYWKFDENPADFVEWFGEKYDLITRDQWDPFGIARRAIRP